MLEKYLGQSESHPEWELSEDILSFFLILIHALFDNTCEHPISWVFNDKEI